jgi:hypothetical protein
MKKFLFQLSIVCSLAIMITMSGCTENYSNGERIGLMSKFSKKGLFFKTWEGDLVLTQTGMNQSANKDFEFSLDKDDYDETLRAKLDSAVTYGWKVKVRYHETFGYNWFGNRGETNYFVTSVEVLDKDIIGHQFGNFRNTSVVSDSALKGYIIDTLLVLRKH